MNGNFLPDIDDDDDDDDDEDYDVNDNNNIKEQHKDNHNDYQKSTTKRTTKTMGENKKEIPVIFLGSFMVQQMVMLLLSAHLARLNVLF